MRRQHLNRLPLLFRVIMTGWLGTAQSAGILARPLYPWLHSSLCLLILLPGAATAEIQERQFAQIIDLVQALYAPDFRQRQQRLQITGYWDDERASASAHMQEDRNGKLAVIAVTGGLARHPAITDAAFALVVCHEIGHFLAGAPAVRGYSTEGQSDYFAAAACMRRVMHRMLSENRLDRHFVPPVVHQRCGAAHDLGTASEACAQTIMAGYALSRYFAYQKSIDAPQFETPDPSRPEVVSFRTPTVQCRLDTYIAAALCNPGARNATHADRPWLCSSDGALAEFARPACWYPAAP